MRPCETRTVQHYRAQPAIVRHDSNATFNQGVVGSNPTRPTRSCCKRPCFLPTSPLRYLATRRNADISPTRLTRPNITGGDGRAQVGTDEHRRAGAAAPSADRDYPLSDAVARRRVSVSAARTSTASSSPCAPFRVPAPARPGDPPPGGCPEDRRPGLSAPTDEATPAARRAPT